MNTEVNDTARDMAPRRGVSGSFTDLNGERYYAIRNVDKMAPFFMSVISSADHWLFVSSTGGLTAGRISPVNALFPYITVDKIHDSAGHTGSKTVLRVARAGRWACWEPFNRDHDDRYTVERNLYKSVLGDKLCFEEINRDLELAFRYTWATSDKYGFVRRCELENFGGKSITVDLLDGLQNILPAGTPAIAQTNASNLVDAYKWTELDADSGLAMYALYSGISDRAEPSESLRANVVYCLGLDDATVLLSSIQLDSFKQGQNVTRESCRRGIRGAYFISTVLELPRRTARHWQIVADIEQSQGQVVALIRELREKPAMALSVVRSVDTGTEELAGIVAAADGFQAANEETVTAHHYANVLFNVLRGGIFDDQYNIPTADFSKSVRHFNKPVYEHHRELLENLDEKISCGDLLSAIKKTGDSQLERLCYEYLPITFGRRHGDPSRPWNMFAIRLKDRDGGHLLSYEGNWRDIFQNWEALIFSYPEFAEYVVAKFVNASTVDGYNPYRITKQGIDWEIEEPGNPWSYIGYWGDHQIIYLLKLLEISRAFHPTRLSALLRRPIYSYANVPYRIRSFGEIVENPKSTVEFDHEVAGLIANRVAEMGADGKLQLDAHGRVYQVNLIEKLLVPLLAKLGNLVIDGGIWLNTQRPEWNDANNALVGHGVSMVTLYYMRRYVKFLQQLLIDEPGTIELSTEVAKWIADTAAALADVLPALENGGAMADQRFDALEALGGAAFRYRQSVYCDHPFSGKVALPVTDIVELLEDALLSIDHSIRSSRRKDGLYHSYNLLDLAQDTVSVDSRYLMLEGQVAVLSSGSIDPESAVGLLEALFDSSVYRADQNSFMLYPDRALPGFLQKNRIPEGAADGISLLQRMERAKDERLISRDADGYYRFNADFRNVNDLNAQLDELADDYGDEVAAARPALRALYESVFRHREFTGRSGGMFGFEGLGCIYWHMVSKLLLAVQENYFGAQEREATELVCARLADLYYRVRDGLGFNKSPHEYGAFPTDPYSHTPGHSGAQQPGMTGQVKEEVLTRFGELGLRIGGGSVHFNPGLLRAREFSSSNRSFRYLDVSGEWTEVEIPTPGLAYTWCQVPIVYQLVQEDSPALTITWKDGSIEKLSAMSLSVEQSSELFRRSGRIRQISARFPRRSLLGQ